jgi:septum formation protein
MQADYPEIILASASAARAAILGNAGVRFHQRPSALNENEATEQLADGTPPEAVAMHLARLKADLVLRMEPDAVVIGADQVLSAGPEILQKPGTQAEARLQLEKLRGSTHQLHSAVIVLHKGHVASFADTATLKMRDFSDEFLDWYLETAGDGVLTSVGAYHFEGLGIHLFSEIKGDYYTILGLPIVPLLEELRRLAVFLK